MSDRCQADADVVRERLDQRRRGRSDADWAIYAEIARRWEELKPQTLGGDSPG